MILLRISRNKRLVCISLWYGTNTPVFYYKHDHFVFCKINVLTLNMRDDLFIFCESSGLYVLVSGNGKLS